MGCNETILSDYTTHLEQQVQELRALKNQAFDERNQLVALLSKMYPSHLAVDTSGTYSLEDVVYIQLPTGQVSWHITKNQLPLFEHLHTAEHPWDGHSHKEKWERVRSVSGNKPFQHIAKVGKHPVPKELLAQAKKNADISFCVIHDEELFLHPDLLPLDKENFPTSEPGILVRGGPTIDPHEDEYVGNGNRPAVQQSLFWVLDNPSQRPIKLQVGTECVNLKAGDYAIFDDSVMHCVVASHVWRGVAWQMCQPQDDIRTRLRSDPANELMP